MAERGLVANRKIKGNAAHIVQTTPHTAVDETPNTSQVVVDELIQIIIEAGESMRRAG